MKKRALRVVAMLLASVLLISEFNVAAYATELPTESELSLDSEEVISQDSSQDDGLTVHPPLRG